MSAKPLDVSNPAAHFARQGSPRVVPVWPKSERLVVVVVIWRSGVERAFACATEAELRQLLEENPYGQLLFYHVLRHML